VTTTGTAVVPAIELRDIVKRFPGVVANDGVSLRVMPGTIHAIVGENGAGKSTLMKTLYGAHRPDEGTVRVNGLEQHFRSPRDAITVGIGMVFQHFMLADNLTVWENIILGDEPGSRFRMDVGAARKRINELASRFGLEVDPDELVADLGVGEKQRAEILKVLFRNANIIILDEPTAVLVPQEVDRLFDNLRSLVARGVTIIFISHKLDEVLKVADAITVIRMGRTVAEVVPSEVTARDLAELMVGSELPTPETRESTVTDEPALRVTGLRVKDDEGRTLLDDISFTIHRGEILGVAGVEGNGQTELIEAIMGLEPLDSGAIVLGGVDLARVGTRARRESGLGYIPQDRQQDGLVLTAPLWENVALGHQTTPPFAKGPWVDKRGAIQRTREIIDEFDVRTPGPDVAALALSGGNQQKLVVGREMTAEPRVLIAAHPTRGIDVGAQADIWEDLRKARAAGLAVLLISADLEELIGLSDTLVVFLRGRLVATLDPATVTPVDLGSYMTGAREAQGAA
jgi:simple sugar transport system ATP-binding protein